MSYYWVNLFDFTAMSKERVTALKDWLSAQGMQLAISIDNSAPSVSELDSEFEKDLTEEAEAQGVDVKAARAGLQDDVHDLLTPRRQSGGGL
jgi:hypothetical protein